MDRESFVFYYQDYPEDEPEKSEPMKAFNFKPRPNKENYRKIISDIDPPEYNEYDLISYQKHLFDWCKELTPLEFEHSLPDPEAYARQNNGFEKHVIQLESYAELLEKYLIKKEIQETDKKLQLAFPFEPQKIEYKEVPLHPLYKNDITPEKLVKYLTIQNQTGGWEFITVFQNSMIFKRPQRDEPTDDIL